MLYRAWLPAAVDGWTLDLQTPVHDYAHVLVNSRVVAEVDRSSGQTSLQLPATTRDSAMDMEHGNDSVLDILVQVCCAGGCVVQ